MPEDPELPDPAVRMETARSFGLLLSPSDLPGSGWDVVEERSWPTGRLDPTSEKSRRALRTGGITAWRKFGRNGPGSAWVEVVPYASDEDGLASLAQVPGFFVGVTPPGETVQDERVVGDREVVGLAAPWILDKSTTGPDGGLRSRYVAGAVGRILVLTCLSGPPGQWTWDEVLGLAAAQSARVRTAGAPGPGGAGAETPG